MDRNSQHMEYSVFVSYSHEDTDLAKHISLLIERYRAPRGLFVPEPVRNEQQSNKFKRVFRDELELGLTSQLTESLKAALEKSEYLLVVCSPASASSSWVSEEVEYFLSLGRGDRIVTAIASGEPDASVRGYAPQLECYPDAIRTHYLKDSPHSGPVVDLPGLDLRNVELSSLRYRTTPFSKLMAQLLSLEPNDYQQRQAIEESRRRLNMAVSGLVLIVLFSGISAVALLMHQRADLQEALNRTISEKANLEAITAVEKQSILLANQASLTEDPAVATLLAIEAWNVAPVRIPSADEEERVLNGSSRIQEVIDADDWESRLERIAAYGGIGRFGPRHPNAATQLRRQFIRSREIDYKHFESGFAKFDVNSSRTLVGIGYESGHYYIARRGSEEFWAFGPHKSDIVALFFTDDDSRLVVVSKQRVDIVNTATMKVDFSGFYGDKDIGRVAISRETDKIALGSWDGEVSVFSLKDLEITGNLTLGRYRPGLAWTLDGDLLVGQGNVIQKFAGGEIDKPVAELLQVEQRIRDIEVIHPGNVQVVIEQDSWVRIIGSQHGTDDRAGLRMQLEGSPKSMSIIELRDEYDRLYAVGGTGAVSVWEISSASKLRTLGCGEAWTNDIQTSPGHTLLAAVTADGRICVWDTQDYRRIWRSHQMNFTLSSARFIDEFTLATISNKGSLQVWDLGDKAPVDRVQSCGRKVDHIVYAPKGDYLFGGTGRFGLCRWNLSTLEVLQLPDYRLSKEFYPFAADGETLLVTGKGRKIYRLQLETLEIVDEVDSGNTRFKDVGYNAGSSVVVGHSTTQQLVFWDERDEFQEEPVILSKEFEVAPSVWMTSGDLEFIFLHDETGRGHVFDGGTGGHLLTLVAAHPVAAMEPLDANESLVVVLEDGQGYRIPFKQFRNGSGEELALDGASRFESVTIPGNWFLIPLLTRDSAFLIDPSSGSVVFESRFEELFPGRVNFLRTSPDGKSMAATYAEGITPAESVLIWRLPQIVARRQNLNSRADLKALRSMPMEQAEILRQFWALESEKWAHDYVSAELHRCLTYTERRTLKLAMDPPCWCSDKSYPTRSDWRYALGYDPFADERADGTRCGQ